MGMMLHLCAVTVLLSCSLKTITTCESPFDNVKRSCDLGQPESDQKSHMMKRSNTVENIDKYIEFNVKRDTVNEYPVYAKRMQAVFQPNFELDHSLKSGDVTTQNLLELFGRDTKDGGEGYERITKGMSQHQIKHWLEDVRSARKHASTQPEVFMTNWPRFLTLSKEILQDEMFQSESTLLSLPASLSAMGLTDVFLKLFWPFRFNITTMNLKLATQAISSSQVDVNNMKTEFFKNFENMQSVKMPYAEKEIVFSFDHPELVDGMNRTKLVTFTKDFVRDKKHLFNETERKIIIEKTLQAMTLINETHPELHKSLVQLVACFAFYKAELPTYIGGSTSNALGVIWLDPSGSEEWEVPFYAEMIVHEFIHTNLFYAELVHGTYTDHDLLSKAKVISAIRGELRDYDKSFHAAYVAAGLATFHSKAGYLKRAEQLTGTLRSSVDDLETVNADTGVLNESGTAMLKFLTDYMALTRMKRN